MTTKKSCAISNVSRCRLVISTVILTVLGVAISMAVFYAAYSWERQSVRREFDSLAQDRFHAIGNVIDSSARLLQFTDNVFLVGPRADSPEFANYVRSLKAVVERDISGHPAVRAVTWMPLVPSGERAAYEQAARKVFDPKFQFSDSGDSVSTGSGQQPEEYFPNYLSITTTPGLDQPGKDLAHDPAIWKVMKQARDTGRTIASAPIPMSANANDRLGYRLFMPLYRGSPENIESRRKSIAGFVCVDMDIGESVTEAFIDIPPVGIDVKLSDDTDGKAVTICQHTSRMKSPATVEGEQGSIDEMESAWTTDYFGRKMLLSSSTAPAFWAGRTIWQPWVLLCGGLVLTLTVAGYRLSLAIHTNAIERTVETRIAAFCQDIERQQKSTRNPKQKSPPDETANDGVPMPLIGDPISPTDINLPTAYHGE